MSTPLCMVSGLLNIASISKVTESTNEASTASPNTKGEEDTIALFTTGFCTINVLMKGVDAKRVRKRLTMPVTIIFI